MARILIASPPVARRIQHHDLGFMPFLGMGYLAGSMRERGHDVRVADSRLGRIDLPGLLELTKEFRPDVIGFSAMTHEIRQVYRAAAAIKRLLPGCRIAVGGPHASALPAQTLEECEDLDLACFGEGETTLGEAVEAWGSAGAIADCPGSAWRDPLFPRPTTRPYPLT